MPEDANYGRTEGAVMYEIKEIEYQWFKNGKNLLKADPDPDGETPLLPFGFFFPYFGEEYNEAWYSSEGFISFGEKTTYCYNSGIGIPSSSPKNYARNKIAAFWDDLNTGG